MKETKNSDINYFTKAVTRGQVKRSSHKKILNLGILAHIDAGKTSLTERILYENGFIQEVGSVDKGTTQTDSLKLEQQRGITIKSAVASFTVNDVLINLIDTPGHPDFIAEVERVLNVLDGVVMVVSAVEGVQAQTIVLMRTLQQMQIPTLIFVNKIDRAGAKYEDLLQSISRRLTSAVIPMGSICQMGTQEALYKPHPFSDDSFNQKLIELLADHDDAFLTKYIKSDGRFSNDQLLNELAVQTKSARMHPVFFGSAKTGTGVDSLINGITTLLPLAKCNLNDPIGGYVFKIERNQAGEKIAYVRMFSGSLKVREQLEYGLNKKGKVTSIKVFNGGMAHTTESIQAGQIGKLSGLNDSQIGDVIGKYKVSEGSQFAPPTLETVIQPECLTQRGVLYASLVELAEQDPLINLRQDDIRQELYVSLYGEVQKEVIQATLANDYGINVKFCETTTVYIERPMKVGSAIEVINKEPNPFLATVGLRIEPAPIGTGLEYKLEVEPGAMPLSFHKAVEKTVRETLQQGLYGWEVTDCKIIMTHCGYWARQSSSHGGFDKSMSSTATDFRNLTPLVLMNALQKAGTTVFEPINRFYLEIPEDTLAQTLQVLSKVRAVPMKQTKQGSIYAIEGEIPASCSHQLQLQLLGLTRGEGVFKHNFAYYKSIDGKPPYRPRTDHNPLNRKEYLLHVVRKV